ncbi:hypothetical protein, partial [Novipirellula rosea]|uniref:hypothetical protein n=1 Tax=Novipirellula rosea TaxID=1031540 RepID=UPI0031E8FD51
RTIYLPVKTGPLSTFRGQFQNPSVTFLTAIFCEEFLAHAKKLRTQWCVKVKRELGRNVASSTRHELRVMEGVDTMLAYQLTSVVFTGILVVNGEHIQPSKWDRVAMSADVIAN